MAHNAAEALLLRGPPVVQLNVGGVLFQTSRETLLKVGMLGHWGAGGGGWSAMAGLPWGLGCMQPCTVSAARGPHACWPRHHSHRTAHRPAL